MKKSGVSQLSLIESDSRVAAPSNAVRDDGVVALAPATTAPAVYGHFVSDASFWVPDLIVDSAWHEHAPFAFWLIEALRPASIVELGTLRGFSYFAFCQAVERLGLKTSCAAVDTWKGDDHAGFYGEDIFRAMAADHVRYQRFSRLIRSSFDEARGEFNNGSIDLIHIDGCHYADAVRHDFDSWRHKLSSRAIVLMHDTAERGLGVIEVWQKLKRMFPHFEFDHGHGLGVLGVGTRISPALHRLFSASRDPQTSRAIRAVYARLGQAVSDRHRLVRAEERASEFETSTSWRLTTPLRALGRLLRF